MRRRGSALPYKVIQWGVGRNGRALVRAIARHRDLELLGARVWSETKSGTDAGVLAGIADLCGRASSVVRSQAAAAAPVTSARRAASIAIQQRMSAYGARLPQHAVRHINDGRLTSCRLPEKTVQYAHPTSFDSAVLPATPPGGASA